MARIANFNRPKDTRRTLKQMLSYLGRHKWYMLVIALLVTISALASILGTYMLKPVINRFILPGDIPGLVKMLLVMGALYLCGALSCYAYNQMMVHISQKVVNEIRSDLFRHTQRLPLTYFDAHTHGELMSRFTNDVDTISEALNNSCHDDTELHNHNRNHYHAAGAGLASFPYCHGISDSHGSVYPL